MGRRVRERSAPTRRGGAPDVGGAASAHGARDPLGMGRRLPHRIGGRVPDLRRTRGSRRGTFRAHAGRRPVPRIGGARPLTPTPRTRRGGRDHPATAPFHIVGPPPSVGASSVRRPYVYHFVRIQPIVILRPSRLRCWTPVPMALPAPWTTRAATSPGRRSELARKEPSDSRFRGPDERSNSADRAYGPLSTNASSSSRWTARPSVNSIRDSAFIQ